MKDFGPPGGLVSANACCHPSICTRKGYDPLEYAPFKFCCYQWFPQMVGTSCSCWQTTSKFHLSDPCKKINLANKITVWHTRFYTVIFVQCINRSSKLWMSIVVACDKLGELTNTYQVWYSHLSHNLPLFHTRSEVLHQVWEKQTYQPLESYSSNG